MVHRTIGPGEKSEHETPDLPPLPPNKSMAKRLPCYDVVQHPLYAEDFSSVAMTRAAHLQRVAADELMANGAQRFALSSIEPAVALANLAGNDGLGLRATTSAWLVQALSGLRPNIHTHVPPSHRPRAVSAVAARLK